MNQRRNPYLILGIDHGEGPAAASSAFAAAVRRARRGEHLYSIEDLTWALHKIEHQSEESAAELATFRVPADPSVYPTHLENVQVVPRDTTDVIGREEATALVGRIAKERAVQELLLEQTSSLLSDRLVQGAWEQQDPTPASRSSWDATMPPGPPAAPSTADLPPPAQNTDTRVLKPPPAPAASTPHATTEYTGSAPPPIGLGDALQMAVNEASNYRGRATRAEFWWVSLTMFVANTAFGLVPSMLYAVGRAPGGLFSLAYLAMLVAFVVVGLSTGVRRMHDSGQSGLWLVVPIVNLVLLLMPSDPYVNRYGPPRQLPMPHPPR